MGGSISALIGALTPSAVASRYSSYCPRFMKRMRQELKDALQARWDESLKARAALAPCSLVPTLDRLLAPLREIDLGGGRNLASQIPPIDRPGTAPRVA